MNEAPLNLHPVGFELYAEIGFVGLAVVLVITLIICEQWKRRQAKRGSDIMRSHYGKDWG